MDYSVISGKGKEPKLVPRRRRVTAILLHSTINLVLSSSILSISPNMKLSSVAAFTLLSSLATVLASDVLDLTKGSFEGEVNGHDLALVE